MKPIHLTYLIIITLIALLTPSLVHELSGTKIDVQCELTHDEALALCEALDMVYEPEAEGYSTVDFCNLTMED